MAREKFKFLVNDVFNVTGKGTVVCGKVESGSIHIGAIVNVSNKGQQTIKDITMHKKSVNCAKTGDSVGILIPSLNKDDVVQGDYITALENNLEVNCSSGKHGENNSISDNTDKLVNKIENQNTTNDDVLTKHSTTAMFCFKCGNPVNEKFKHCPYCVIKLSTLNNIIPEKNCNKRDGKSSKIEFLIAERKICFTQEFINYNTLRKRFFDKATELENAYMDYYKSKDHTFNSLFDEEVPEVNQKFKQKTITIRADASLPRQFVNL